MCSSQHVIQTSLGGYQSVDELLIPGGRIYEQRNFIYKAINDIPGLSAVKPKAGLYIFPKIDRNMYDIEDDEEFVFEFLKKEKFSWFMAVALAGMNQITSVLSTFLVWKSWLKFKKKSNEFLSYYKR